MHDQSFADEVGGINIRDGVVRIDLVSYPPAARDDEGNPAPIFCGRLVMTIPDMLRSYDKMRGVMKKLVDQGMVIRNQEEKRQGQASGAAKKPSAKTSTGGASSPNFPGGGGKA